MAVPAALRLRAERFPLHDWRVLCACCFEERRSVLNCCFHVRRLELRPAFVMPLTLKAVNRV